MVRLNTVIDNRTAFFGLYAGSPEVVRDINGFLHLKDISLLTDDEVYNIAIIIYGCPIILNKIYKRLYINKIRKNLQDNKLRATAKVVDYLRYCGYAWEWMGFSVVDQINNGWIKLHLSVKGKR